MFKYMPEEKPSGSSRRNEVKGSVLAQAAERNVMH